MVYNLRRSASVRAATPCVIFLLDRADLNRVLKHYPEGQFQCRINPLPSASSLDNPGGVGDIPRDAGPGCVARFPKPKAYLRQKSAILHSPIVYPIYDRTKTSTPCFIPALR